MLMIASEGRLAALDMLRLINSRQPADPGGKVAQCAERCTTSGRRLRASEGAAGLLRPVDPKSGMAFSVYQALREG